MTLLTPGTSEFDDSRDPPDSTDQTNLRLRIGEEVVDFGALRVVTRPDVARLTSKSAAVLLELVRRAGDTVTRDELLGSVWKGRCTTPDVLTQAVKELRRALADDARPPRYIETVPKVGYRLIAPVLPLDDPAPEAGDAQTQQPQAAAIDVTPPVIVTPVAPARRLPWIALATVSGLVVAVMIALLLAISRYSPAFARNEPGWRTADVRVLTSDPGPERRPHISADGTRIAFSIADPDDTDGKFDRVVVQSVEASRRIRLSAASAAHEALPVWSPDGARIAFKRTGDDLCSIFVASSLGGDERKVGDCDNYKVSYYDWTPDGRGLLTSLPGDGPARALARLDLDSGEREFLHYAREPTDQDLDPRQSPDGRWIAFRRGGAPYSDLYVMPAAGGAVRRLTHISARIRGYTWSRNSRALVFASNHDGGAALYVVDIDTGRLQDLGIAPAEFPDAARSDDTVVYELPRTQHQLAQVSLTGKGGAVPHLLAPSTGSDQAPSVSPAGDRIVFVSDRSGQSQLWMHDLTTGATVQLTDAASGAVFSPSWSADGSRVVAVRKDGEARQLVEIEVASRRLRTISAPGVNVLMGMYGADPDSYLVLHERPRSGNELVLVQRPEHGDASRRELVTNIAYFQIDAPGRALYYTRSDGSGLFRSDLDGANPRLVTTAIDAISMSGWRVVDGRIWYLSNVDVRPVLLREVEPASGAERILATLDIPVKNVDFAVQPDHQGIIVTVLGAEDTDVGAFRLIAPGAP